MSGKMILEMKGIRKAYPNGIMANRGVDFSLREGEIHGLVGENGAGKTTLMKVLFGLCHAEAGEILLDGERLSAAGPQVAIAAGIGMVHQHFMLVPSLTVAENMVLGVEPRTFFALSIRKAVEITEALAKEYNLRVEARAAVADIPVGMKQKVEILKALHRGARILILDEPTAVLTPQEAGELFEELRNLADKGNTIVLISHRLNEIKAVCDRVTVMRNGVSLGVFDVADVTEQDISRLMVGRDVVLRLKKEPADPGELALQVDNLTIVDKLGREVVHNLSFGVRHGEILGIAGVEGNGQRELVDALTGMDSYAGGSIIIGNMDVASMSIRDIRDVGTAHIPEDRMTQGCASELSIEMNLLAYSHDAERFNRRNQTMNMGEIGRYSHDLIERYGIACTSAHQSVGGLSGGNIQKVVVAREFSSQPKFIVADQPTRGIDVGATEFIRRRLVELRDAGCAVLLISADLNEIMELSDSLIVMYSGAVTAYIRDASAVTESELGLYMLGLKRQDESVVREACGRG